jgi:hypothetical protein
VSEHVAEQGGLIPRVSHLPRVVNKISINSIAVDMQKKSIQLSKGVNNG